MFEFVIIALAVMVGSLMAGVVAVLIVYNKHTMKWITKKAMAVSKEVTEEILEGMDL